MFDSRERFPETFSKTTLEFLKYFYRSRNFMGDESLTAEAEPVANAEQGLA